MELSERRAFYWEVYPSDVSDSEGRYEDISKNSQYPHMIF